ncbi:MAG TPA: glycosyltransferase family 39 protein [Polyangia bacterium]
MPSPTPAMVQPTPSPNQPPPPEPITARQRALGVGLPMLVAALLFWPYLSRIPGVNADEAWVLERVRELAQGARPWNGMTFYVAAIHQYLVWPCVSLFGEHPFAIRLPGAVLNVAAVGLIAATARQIWGARTGLFAGLLIATAPFLVTHARFGIEVPALSPFYAAVAFATLGRLRPTGFARGARPLPRTYLLAWLGGVGLGALAYNHIVLLPVPIAIGLTMLFAGQARVVASPITLMALLGFLFGCSPRLYDIMQPGMLKLWLSQGKSSGWPADILPMFGLLLGAWDGRILYQRFAGGSALFVLPYPALAFLALLVLRVRAVRAARVPATGPVRFAGFSRTEGFVVVALVIAAVLTTRIAPHLSIRYAVVLHVSLPVLLAAFARSLLQGDAHTRRPAVAILVAVIALNVAYLAVNFFAPFLRAGGGLSVFRIGNRLIETSNHFAREDELYARLRARGVTRVDADIFIVRPLQMWDRDRVLRYGEVEPALNAPGRALERTAVIFYNGLQWHGTIPPFPTDDARTFGPTIRRNNLDLQHDPSFPPLFRVYIAEPASPP